MTNFEKIKSYSLNEFVEFLKMFDPDCQNCPVKNLCIELYKEKAIRSCSDMLKLWLELPVDNEQVKTNKGK